MKKLKYIQVFEAFKSNKLSKTLKFINKSYRDNFLKDITKLCGKSNFPLSELDDSLFTYLPFKRAVLYHEDPVEIPCTATSESEFNSSAAIPGEKCEDGKLKRTWGAGRVRVMTCPNCNGTGIEPFAPKWKYLKFWFNINGDYVATTATDGVERYDEESVYRYDIPVEISYSGNISKKYYRDNIENIEKNLKTANFALILDLDKIELKSKEVTSTYTTRVNRENIKKDSLKLKSDSEIKDENIKRYFDIIRDRSQLKGNLDDISNLKSLTIRLLGGPNMLFFINENSNSDVIYKLSNISDGIFEIMSSLQKDSSQDLLINKINNVNYEIKSHLNNIQISKERLKKSLEITKKYILEKYTEDNESIKIFKNLINIKELFYSFISNYKIETLYDFEELLADLVTIQGIMNKQRYLHTLGMFFDKSTTTYSYDDAKYYICDYRLNPSQLKDAVEGTERFINFLKNKYSL